MRLALALLMTAGPAAAQALPDPALVASLLTAPGAEARVAGAIGACLHGATDPAAAIAALDAAGWEPSGLAPEGSAGFDAEGASVVVDHVPGHCVVEAAMDAPALLTALRQVLDRADLPQAVPVAGLARCPAYDLQNGLLAELTAAGDGRACTGPTGAALRFTPAAL